MYIGIWGAWTSKIGYIGCSKTSVTDYESILHNFPEEGSAQLPRFSTVCRIVRRWNVPKTSAISGSQRTGRANSGHSVSSSFTSSSSPDGHYRYHHVYLLTPCCRVLLEKLTGLQLIQKFSAFHGTRRFITALTSVRQLSLSWASPIQSIYTHPTSWRSILILSAHPRLGLPSGLLPSGFPTRNLYTFNIKNSIFCPHNVFPCFVWISEQTAIIFLSITKWLVL